MNNKEVFIGRYCRKLQKDCRLWIPKEFRDIFSLALQNPKHRLILQRGDHGVELCLGAAVMASGEPCQCLMCLVPAITAWDNKNYCAWPVSFDRHGRLPIPAVALEFIRAKPGENVIILGLIDHVEIISERVWKEEHAATKPTQVA
jgi:DNA-binding transcriptional regulator/RsmH inhibitor MraZ